MARMRRVLLVAVAAGLAVAGPGCGDGGADEVSAELPFDFDLLSATEEAGSARASFRFASEEGLAGEDDSTLGTWRTSAEFEGMVAFSDEPRSTFSGRFEMGLVPPEGAVDEAPELWSSSVEMRIIGEESWSREERDGQPGPWTLDQELTEDEIAAGGEVAEDEVAADGGDDPFALLDPGSFDPRGFVEALRDAAEVFTEKGDEEVRGDPTTRYEVTLDATIGDGDWYDLDGKVEVWLDGDERLRRVRGGTMEMELWDFGIAVDVEPPDEVAGPDDEDAAWGGLSLFPEVVGDWALQTEGSVRGESWQVFAAPARQGDTEVTCRTLEVTRSEPDTTPWPDDVGSLPNHDGAPATCGSMGFFMSAVTDPALQVLTGLDTDHLDADPVGVVGFVVSERFRSGPIRVVLDGADAVELPIDATGVAVWDASVAAAVVAVELDGGAVRCPAYPEALDEGADDEAVLEASGGDDPVWLQLSGGLAPCVRA